MASGRPTPLIRLGGDGAWCVEEEGAALLDTVRGPVCVVAVAGLYRTGKSFFLNSLAGRVGSPGSAAGGFRVGATSESCTRGIDVFVVPSDESCAPACGATLVLLDTEGLASMEQDEGYDAQIFALALLLSSYFVINSMGVIDEAAIDRLYMISELGKHICVNSAADDDAPAAIDPAELAGFFPPLCWLLRDFTLTLASDGEPITEQAYMEKALEPRPQSARRAAERNQIRAAIRDYFPARHCRTLVRPASDEADLRDASSLPAERLRPQFIEQMAALRAEVLARAPVKAMYGSHLDGGMLLGLARRYIVAMNTEGVVPAIKSAWESVVHERCFAWEVRREKLIRAIREMDADLFSLVECDHYHDFFEPKLGAHGFDSIWRKRPRRSSDDGCAISRMHCPHAQPSPRRKRTLIAVPSPFRQVRDRLAARSLRAPRVEPP